jgi:hypothetical protein
MKKIVLALVVLMLASPAWAAITITATQVSDTNEVTITYANTEHGNGDANEIRAFALDITVDMGKTITSISNLDPNYWVYPGTNGIDINDTTGEVDSTGTPIADPCQAPGDTESGLGTSGITIEMGSLYVGAPNAPDGSGTLLNLVVNTATDCNVSIIGNAARAGTGSKPGVVMKVPSHVVLPTFVPGHLSFGPSTYTVSGQVTYEGSGLDGVTIGGLPNSPIVTSGGGNYSDTVPAGWNGTITPSHASYGFKPASRSPGPINSNTSGLDFCAYPGCWDYSTQCHGDTDGDVDVDIVDWPTYRDGFGSSYPSATYKSYVCADFDHDGDIDIVDWPQFRDYFGQIPGSDCAGGDPCGVYCP